MTVATAIRFFFLVLNTYVLNDEKVIILFLIFVLSFPCFLQSENMKIKKVFNIVFITCFDRLDGCMHFLASMQLFAEKGADISKSREEFKK